MEISNSSWEDILYELNNFSCKIEFLEGETRSKLCNEKKINMNIYFNNLKKLLNEHKYNLFNQLNIEEKNITTKMS